MQDDNSELRAHLRDSRHQLLSVEQERDALLEVLSLSLPPFSPFTLSVTLSVTLSITVSATLSVTLSVTLERFRTQIRRWSGSAPWRRVWRARARRRSKCI